MSEVAPPPWESACFPEVSRFILAWLPEGQPVPGVLGLDRKGQRGWRMGLGIMGAFAFFPCQPDVDTPLLSGLQELFPFL